MWEVLVQGGIVITEEGFWVYKTAREQEESAMRVDNIRIAALRESEALAEQRASIIHSPFVVLRPKLFPDGDKWCALYGENLQDGVAGFGDTPAEAAADFNEEWFEAKARKPQMRGLHPAGTGAKL